MMSGFDWKTEEDRDSPIVEPEQGPALPPRRRRLLFLFLALLLFVAGGLFWGYRVTEEHLAQTNARVKRDVRASHELVKEAARHSDLELFQRFLSSADPDWTRAQKQIVADDLWLQRPVLGLQWQSSVTSSAAITLSADLLEAEVVSRETYAPRGDAPSDDPLTFLQTFVYRLGPDRWLYAPPRADFWGETQTTRLSRLRLIYPARDEAIAQRLAQDLNGVVERACGELPDLRCSDEYRLGLDFSSDAGQLLVGSPGAMPLWGQATLALPTPTLVGIPQDQAAYEALFRGYAVHVAATAVADQVGWECCEKGLFFQALLQQQLQRLELLPPVSAEAADVTLLSQGRLNVHDFDHLWDESPKLNPLPPTTALPSALSIVDFIQERRPELSAGALQRELAAAPTYDDWLSRVVGDVPEAELALSFASFLRSRPRQAQSASPPALPREDPLLLCRTEDGTSSLLRYDLRAESLLPQDLGADFQGTGPATTIEPMPSGGALIVDHHVAPGGEGARLRLLLWDDGQQRLLWDSGELAEDRYHYVDLSPDGRHVVVEEINPERRLNAFLVGEVAQCLEKECRWNRSIYRPTWSPDGRYIMNAMPQGNLVFLSEAQYLVQPFWYLDYGTSPFWLNVQTFGYVKRSADDRLSSVVIGSVSERQVQTLVTRDDLLSRLPSSTILTPSVNVVRHPADPRLLFLAVEGVRSPGPSPTHIFVILRDGPQISLLLTVPDADLSSLSLSPSGRWLALDTAEGSLVYDLVRSRSELLPSNGTAPPPSWSPEGDWLLAVDEGSLRLYAPGGGARQALQEPVSCQAVVWPAGS